MICEIVHALVRTERWSKGAERGRKEREEEWSVSGEGRERGWIREQGDSDEMDGDRPPSVDYKQHQLCADMEGAENM